MDKPDGIKLEPDINKDVNPMKTFLNSRPKEFLKKRCFLIKYKIKRNKIYSISV